MLDLEAKKIMRGTFTYAELAEAYFPAATTDVARRAFTGLIRKNQELCKILAETGFRPGCRNLTPTQVHLIFEYLVAPLDFFDGRS